MPMHHQHLSEEEDQAGAVIGHQQPNATLTQGSVEFLTSSWIHASSSFLYQIGKDRQAAQPFGNHQPSHQNAARLPISDAAERQAKGAG